MKTFKCDTIIRNHTETMLGAYTSFADYTQQRINEKVKTIDRLYEEASNTRGAERAKIKARIFELAQEIQEAQQMLDTDLLKEVA